MLKIKTNKTMAAKFKYRTGAAGIIAVGTTLKEAKTALVYGRISGNGAKTEKRFLSGRVSYGHSWRINKLKRTSN